MSPKGPQQWDKSKDVQVLQREYRNMEASRKSYAEGCQVTLRKQKQTLDKLRRENDSLKNDIAVLQSRTNPKPTTAFEQGLRDKLYTEIEKYTGLVDIERVRNTSDKEQIIALRKKLWQDQKTMGGVNASKESRRSAEKQVRILENRVEQALVKCNKSTALNRKLRQEIDDLRGERLSFQGMHKKLEKELQDKRSLMGNAIEQSNIAYEQRDKAQLEITAIAQANRKEEEAFEQQLAELGRTLEEELKLLPIKRRVSAKTGNLAGSKKLGKKRDASMENILRKQSHRLTERMLTFEEAFRKIATSADTTDVDELTKTFVANEEHNFSLFSYANEQASEVERLGVQVAALRKEKAKYALESGSDVRQHEHMLVALRDKLVASEKLAGAFEARREQDEMSLRQLRVVIQEMLQSLDCERHAPGETPVTESNILHSLGIIEQKTHEILALYSALKCTERMAQTCSEDRFVSATDTSRNVDTCFSFLGTGPTAPMRTGPTTENPPKLVYYSSDEGSVETGNSNVRPLTRKEVEALVIVQKRSRKGKRNKMVSRTLHSRTALFVAERVSPCTRLALSYALQPSFHPIDGCGQDQGTIQRMVKTNSIVLNDTTMGDKVEVQSSTIGRRCGVGDRCRINDAVVMDDVSIGPNCILQNSVLGSGSIIGENCSLNDVQVAPGATVPSGTKLKGGCITAEDWDEDGGGTT